MLRPIMQRGNSPENGKGPQHLFILWIQKLYEKMLNFAQYIIFNTEHYTEHYTVALLSTKFQRKTNVHLFPEPVT